jgi:hypothetical protein
MLKPLLLAGDSTAVRAVMLWRRVNRNAPVAGVSRRRSLAVNYLGAARLVSTPGYFP